MASERKCIECKVGDSANRKGKPGRCVRCIDARYLRLGMKPLDPHVDAQSPRRCSCLVCGQVDRQKPASPAYQPLCMAALGEKRALESRTERRFAFTLGLRPVCLAAVTADSSAWRAWPPAGAIADRRWSPRCTERQRSRSGAGPDLSARAGDRAFPSDGGVPQDRVRGCFAGRVAVICLLRSVLSCPFQ